MIAVGCAVGWWARSRHRKRLRLTDGCGLIAVWVGRADGMPGAVGGGELFGVEELAASAPHGLTGIPECVEPVYCDLIAAMAIVDGLVFDACNRSDFDCIPGQKAEGNLPLSWSGPVYPPQRQNGVKVVHKFLEPHSVLSVSIGVFRILWKRNAQPEQAGSNNSIGRVVIQLTPLSGLRQFSPLKADGINDAVTRCDFLRKF